MSEARPSTFALCYVQWDAAGGGSHSCGDTTLDHERHVCCCGAALDGGDAR